MISLEWILDDQFIAIRYLHFGYLFFFLFTVGLTLYLLIRQPKKLVWLSPAFIIISINFINPLLPLPTSIASEQSPTQSFSLLSFSINSRNRQYDAVAQLLTKDDYSLICLQEAPASRHQQLIASINKLHTNYYRAYSSKKSLMILSKSPVTTLKIKPYLKATTQIGRKKVTVWNLHSPKSLRIKQYQSNYFNKLQEDIKNDNSLHKIICGDFNSTPHNDIIRRLKRDFHAAHQHTFWPLSYTYPSLKSFISTPLPFIKIDFFLLSNSITVLQYRRLKEYANSDHYPITTTITFQE